MRGHTDTRLSHDEWEQKANSMARSYCPEIYSCMKCGHPVIKGYCCTNCLDTNPSEPRKAGVQP